MGKKIKKNQKLLSANNHSRSSFLQIKMLKEKKKYVHVQKVEAAARKVPFFSKQHAAAAAPAVVLV